MNKQSLAFLFVGCFVGVLMGRQIGTVKIKEVLGPEVERAYDVTSDGLENQVDEIRGVLSLTSYMVISKKEYEVEKKAVLAKAKSNEKVWLERQNKWAFELRRCEMSFEGYKEGLIKGIQWQIK